MPTFLPYPNRCENRIEKFYECKAASFDHYQKDPAIGTLPLFYAERYRTRIIRSTKPFSSCLLIDPTTGIVRTFIGLLFCRPFLSSPLLTRRFSRLQSVFPGCPIP